MLQAGDEFEGFIIVEVLGAGGMGVVYLAQHPRLDSLVALKLLNEALAADPKARAAFEREAELAAGLGHPNIVPIYDRSKPDAARLWLSMRYIRGGDATALLTGSPRGLPAEQAVQLLIDAAAALDYAHADEVLHRDVKPANLLIEYDARHERRVLLTDFGIARTLDDTVTASAIVASFAYTAPERFLHHPADHRIDVYSLGCTLYQLLTGQTPYPYAAPARVMAAHLHDLPPAPCRLRPELPAALDDVVATALAKNPDDRFRSCGELAAAAQAAVDATIPGAKEGVAAASPAAVDAGDEHTTGGAEATVESAAAGAGARRGSGPESSAELTGRTNLIGLIAGLVLVIAVPFGIRAVVTGPTDKPAAAAEIAQTPTVTPFRPVVPTVRKTVPVGDEPGAVAVQMDTLGDRHAYVTNLGENTVSVVETGDGRVIATVPVGRWPVDVATDYAAQAAYVVNGAEGTVSVLDTVTNTVRATVPVGGQPRSVAADPEARTAYVTNTGDGTVSVLDTVTNTVRATVPVGGRPKAVAVDPEARSVYVTDSGAGTVSVLDTETATVRTTVSVGAHPTDVVLDPYTRRAYVVNRDGNTVSVLDTDTHAVIATVAVGHKPVAAVVGDHIVFVVNMGDGSVSILETHAYTVAETFPVGGAPRAVDTVPFSGDRIVVANSDDDTLSMLSTW